MSDLPIEPPIDLIDFHGHCGLQHNTCYAPAEVSAYLASEPVSRILVSSLSSVVSSAYGLADLRALAADPKVVPIYWINPYLREWPDELAALHAEQPVPGVKLHPTANIYELETEFLRPVLAHCRAHHRFLCVHTDTFRCQPQRLTELALDFPDVDVVLIHMDDPIQSIFLARCCPNVYLETSWVERKWETLAPIKIALDSVAPHQILFGTDFPYEFPLPSQAHRVGRARSYRQIAAHYREVLPAADAERILHGNARALLARYGVDVD
jgi:predicted TIM-barrel fold metal-dependent hydrolase